MTTYDSTVGARQNIAAGTDVDATQDRLTGSRLKSATTQAGETVRKRPAVASATALGLAAVTAAGVIGGRKIAQARRPRSRWQRMLDRVR
ncbi:hypothetical protein [Actinoplanes aureus]|jgi:hypothetical protein|uniref:Uncharacterized protein n=1 Tax=Actinoplanes aureus TaxID=2792083 RepID=A0A931CCH1_9ACTN|nr:hypothetical protein [Actinoplanes aureus]MBG0564056.1 hypothetical protein [Actinoplanes aureus]